MTASLGHWLIPQLERLGKTDSRRIEELLDVVRAYRPDLLDELALMAVEHGQLTHEEAAEILGSDTVVVAIRLQTLRDAFDEAVQGQTIVKDKNGVAKIDGKPVSVWEVVREYRRTDSVDAMKGALGSLTESEIRAALVYAGRNPDEIGAQIRAYEEVVERSKAAYPFAKG
jgi:uncharacterized protein (DUF433 family)